MTTLASLANEFSRSGPKVKKGTELVIKKTATEIKKQARASASRSGGSHAARAYLKINYDMHGPADAEIGYDKSGQGNLGAILEFGTPRTGAKRDLTRAWEMESRKAYKYIEDLMDRVWR